MNVEELVTRMRGRLKAAADPAYRRSIQRFFTEPLDAYGVPAPQIRKLAAEAFAVTKSWPAAQRNRFCILLWKSGKNEEGALAVYLYHRFRKNCGTCEFHLFEKWIDRFVTNWGHCDGVSCWLVAASLDTEPALVEELAAWTDSANRWKRRAAAVSLVPSGRKGRHTAVILDVADRLLADPDEMVQKGVGWLLKETYPNQPREVVRFLRAAKARAPRLVLRYAAEKMTPRDRAVVL